MVEIREGELAAEGLQFAIVASRFNDDIVSKLLEGAIECLQRHGATEESIVVYRVPGAFEIPMMVNRLVKTGQFNAIVSVGALVRGDTPHFDFISAQVTNELSRVAVANDVPVTYGVITCNTHEQARERTRKGNNKGWEAALAAIEMANLFRLGAR